MSLTGVHSIYSLTERERYGMESYTQLYLFEFLVLSLSSHLWRQNNGPIKLVCDDNFYEFVKDNQLFWMWDEIDNTTLKKLPQDIDYKIFWTYPKMFIQSQQKERFAIIDADAYTVLDLKDLKEDIIYGHEEKDIWQITYPNLYEIPEIGKLFKGLNPTLEHNAINTCLVVYNNLDIIKEVTEITDKFIKSPYLDFSHPNSSWMYTIYCEQKVLGNIVKDKGYTYRSLTPYPYNCDASNAPYDILPQSGIQHLWVNKQRLKNDYNTRLIFTRDFIRYIEEEYNFLFVQLYPYLNKFKV
jgi:hypothetical protein